MNRQLIICTYLFFFPLISSSQHFVEVSDKVGLTYDFPGNDKQEIGAGITIIDVNNDGWDDIFQSCGIFSNKLWLNNKGKFIDVTTEYGLDFLDTLFVQGACAADYDNDGFEDLFIGNAGNLIFMGDKHSPILLHNVGGKYFEPVFEEIFNIVGNYPGATWGDVNNDGFVDLYLFNYIRSMSNKMDSTGEKILTYEPICNDNLFYLNLQGKGFSERTDEFGLNDAGCGLAATFTDFDLDNDLDLMLVNDFGAWSKKGNKLFKNNYPTNSFSDVSEAYGFSQQFYGMSIGAGDYNNDGFLDYYITNIGRNFLFENKQGAFIERAIEKEIDLSLVNNKLPGTSWSGLFFDVENDGDVDLFVSKGYLNSIEKVIVKDENKLFLNNGNGEFADVSIQSRINDSLVNRGAALLDFDHDGDLDLVSGLIKMSRGEFANLDQKIKLYRNDSEIGNRYIGFKLIGADSTNLSSLGCRVTFNFQDKKQIREVDCGSGHSSQSTKILYFGVSKLKVIRNITVNWMDGTYFEIKKIKTNKTYTISKKGAIKVLYK